MLDAQGRAHRAGDALTAQNQPDAGRIHKAYPAEIQDQRLRAAADQRIVQLDAQALGRVVVDLTGQKGIKALASRAEAHRCHGLSISFVRCKNKKDPYT